MKTLAYSTVYCVWWLLFKNIGWKKWGKGGHFTVERLTTYQGWVRKINIQGTRRPWERSLVHEEGRLHLLLCFSHLFICLFICMHTCAEIREQLEGTDSLLSEGGVQGDPTQSSRLAASTFTCWASICQCNHEKKFQIATKDCKTSDHNLQGHLV